jgi:ribosomal protein L23
MHNFNIRNLFLIFKYQLITEKTCSLFTFNTYVFIVDHNVNKFKIKLIIEYFFKVTVNKKNILNIKKL